MEKIKKPKSSNNKSLKVMKKGDYIDISELSSMIKVSKSHLYYLTSKKLIPHIKVFGKKVLFNINDIENWLESKKVLVK